MQKKPKAANIEIFIKEKDLNRAVNTINMKTMGKTNQLIDSAATIMTEELEYKINQPKQQGSTIPKWKADLKTRLLS